MIKNIGKGGFGSEAKVTVELRTEFPGIGGTITTQQAVVSALREEFSALPGQGHRLFFKHALIKKLDDYFQKMKKYEFSHIPRPIGSNGPDGKDYLYEWVFGSEGFPWFYQDEDRDLPVMLGEWKEFIAAFQTAGIDLSLDCTDSDNGRISKNIIHQLYQYDPDSWSKLNCLWQRIDFGQRSILINFERLAEFAKEQKKKLISALGIDRYEMMILAAAYLENKKEMNAVDAGRLEILTRHYRISTLRHLMSKTGGNILIDSPLICRNTKNNLLK